ncbi:MAG: hypothetical protein R3D85_12340 [Paracoccaceae bacterium]
MRAEIGGVAMRRATPRSIDRWMRTISAASSMVVSVTRVPR